MQTSLLLAQHAADGARIGARPEAPDLDAVLTFGDVPAEYRAATGGCVVFDVTDRGAVRAEGADARSFLHRILANDVLALEPGSGNANLLLTPKGKVVEAFDLRVEDEAIHLSAAPGRESALRTAIDMFLFTEEVELAQAGEDHAPLELAGPDAAPVLAAALDLDAGALQGLAAHASLVTGSGARVTALEVAGAPGLRVEETPERVPALYERLVARGATRAGVVLRDILRVERGSALFGVDVDDNVYPQEARLESSFALDKGCYVGQEVVAKIDTYGGLNKLLMALAVEHDDPVARGTRLLEGEEERELGLVTSWAYSFVLDTGLVLAYVKRKHQEEGTTFTLSDGQGTARIVPFPVLG